MEKNPAIDFLAKEIEKRIGYYPKIDDDVYFDLNSNEILKIIFFGCDCEIPNVKKEKKFLISLKHLLSYIEVGSTIYLIMKE